MSGVLVTLLRGDGIVSVAVAVDKKGIVLLMFVEMAGEYAEDVLSDRVEKGWLVNEF